MKRLVKLSNNKIKLFFSYCVPIFFGLSYSSCTKWDALTSEQEGTVYMSRAYSDKSTLTVYKTDSVQSYAFGASIAGFNGAAKDLNVTFEVDTSLISTYNTNNAYLGYAYKALPSSSYTLSSLVATIKSGESDSDPLYLNLNAGSLPRGVRYMLPVRIVSNDGGNKLDSTLNIAYFKIDSIYVRSNDITSLGGILTVSDENTGGASAAEGSPKLIDNNTATKFLSQNFSSNFWMSLQLSSAQKIDAYTLTSGGDAQGRDPKDWELQASDDGINWITEDKRTSYVFSARTQTVTFECNNSDNLEHSYYRLKVSSIYTAGNYFQMSEWRLLQYY